jgi:PAS domain S-box-containing protein
METVLEKEGYATIVAGSGQEALAILGLDDAESSPRTQPDLVVLDIMLPGPGGHQICERIKQEERLSHLPVIMVTALDSLTDEIKGLQQGADDYITKPFQRKGLLARVEAQLRAKRLYDQSVRAQESVRESEERYRELADSIADVFFATDENLRYTFWNRASEKLTGIPAEDAIGGSLYDLFPDTPQTKRAEKVYRDVLRTQQPQTFVNEYQLGGEDLVFEISAYPSKSGLSVFVKDITERKQAEDALRQSKRRLERRERFITRVLSSIPSSLVVIDRNLDIVSVNRNFLKKMQRASQMTVGHEIVEVFPPVLMSYTHLDDKVQQVFRTGDPLEGGRLSYRTPGLPNRIYYYRLIPLKERERVENVMLLMDDITEQERLREEIRRSERHLASVVECANDLVISLDSEGHILTWNQAAESASGLTAEHVEGRPLPSLCVAQRRQEMTKLLERLSRGDSVGTEEVDLVTDDGQEVPIAWSCSTMRDDAGEVTGIVAVGRDLTERRQMEGQLIQSAKMASLGVMAGGIAHEVRNPLAIISASAQLLRERPDDARLHNQCADKIYRATERASQIIENLLRFARPKGERTQDVDLHAVLKETLGILAHQLALQNITVKEAFQPHVPTIPGNPELLQQVFTNLILNARDAMPDGGTLTIKTRVTDQREVEVAFEDTGRGIPPENLDRIFDPFFTTMPVGAAVGLGLAISYSIVRQHQGKIDVQSEVGEGSTFTVRLPATRA